MRAKSSVQPGEAGFLNKEAKPVSLKKEDPALHRRFLAFIQKDEEDPDKKQDN